MATPTIIVLTAGAVGTVLLVAFAVLVQVERLKGQWHQATLSVERLTSTLEELQVQRSVLERESARLGASLEELERLRSTLAERRRGSARGGLGRRGADW